MKSLTDRLLILREFIWANKEHAEPGIYESALDTWIELNAIAEALPEITIALPGNTPPPMSRVVPRRIIPFDAVFKGGRTG